MMWFLMKFVDVFYLHYFILFERFEVFLFQVYLTVLL